MKRRDRLAGRLEAFLFFLEFRDELSILHPMSAEISRRDFLRAASALAGGLAMAGAARGQAETAGGQTGGALAELPAGPAPEPVSFPHFPDRLHAFVWRNWPLVPLERMARVVRARPADLARLGHAMGLRGPPRIPRGQQTRSYLTIIKHNWHLLPYEQLLELLDWTPEQLAYTLREDDFFFIKLGSLKPRCQRLVYQPPDEAARQREREIARILREELGGEPALPADPLFGFVAALSRPPRIQARPSNSGELRFCYSYFAPYGDPLLGKEAEPYPDGYLARLAQAGVNGVWLQAVLYKLARFPWEPERSARFQTRLENLRKLSARAGKEGIRVFLYLNEPRAMPLGFFAGRPNLKGVVEGDYAALCTSVPEVREHLVESVAAVCRAVPDLGGFFSITASENLSNCWSHGQGAQCPRCSARRAPEVIAEVNALFHQGIRRAATGARLLVWDWGWNDAWAGEAIRLLPAEAAFMSVSEWGLPIERGGVKSEVGEYCLSAVGPGPRALRHWRLARERGLETVAKIQAGNTWELSAVPYIPAVENAARHAERLRNTGVRSLMLGWTLGGFPSPNLEAVSETMTCGSADEGMRRVAERRFGPGLASAVVAAWRGFSAAFSEFPFHAGLLYSGPQQLGPANLLWSAPTGYHASMVGFPYDDLDSWRAIYPAEVFAGQMEKVAQGFRAALERLRTQTAEAQALATAAQRRALAQECRVAEAAAIHFQSAANQARFVLARRALAAAKGPAEAGPQIATLRRLLEEETSLARRLYRLQSEDSRIGFEASNHYFYVPADLAEKILNCRDLLTRWP
jgi:hypothetical protein